MSFPTSGSEGRGPLYGSGNEDDYTKLGEKSWDNWGGDTHSFSSNSGRESVSSSEKTKSVHENSSKSSNPGDAKVKSRRKVTIDESFNQEFEFEDPKGCCPCGRRVGKKIKEYFKRGCKFLANTPPGKCGQKIGEKIRPKLEKVRKNCKEFVSRRVGCLDRTLERTKQTRVVKTLREAGGKVSSGVKSGLDKMGAFADRVGKSKVCKIVQSKSRSLRNKMKTRHAKSKGVIREEPISADTDKFQSGIERCIKRFNQLKEMCLRANPFKEGEDFSVKEASRISWALFKETVQTIKQRANELCTKCRARFGKDNGCLSALHKLSTDRWSGDPNKKGGDKKFPDELQEYAEGLSREFLEINSDEEIDDDNS